MSEAKFEINQKIVYPSQGVGVVTEIFQKEFKGEVIPYYKIYIESSDMVVMIPVDKAEGVGIRAIVSAEEAQKALDLLSDDFEPITSDWKLRYQMNLDLLKKGSISDIATIVRCLYNRSKIKELPILERKLYDSAKKLLEDEVSIAMDKDGKDDVLISGSGNSVYAYTSNFSPFEGFPAAGTGTPYLIDADGDGKDELILRSLDNKIHALQLRKR